MILVFLYFRVILAYHVFYLLLIFNYLFGVWEIGIVGVGSKLSKCFSLVNDWCGTQLFITRAGVAMVTVDIENKL